MASTDSWIQFKVIDKSSKPKLMINWKFQTFIREEQETSRVICYIPCFNLYFQAKSQEEAKIKGKAFTTMFFDHFMKNDNHDKVLNLTRELKRLGFSNPNNLSQMKLVRNIIVPTKFNSRATEIPQSFASSNNIYQESNMEAMLS